MIEGVRLFYNNCIIDELNKNDTFWHQELRLKKVDIYIIVTKFTLLLAMSI